jgi:hypothetical protein
MDRNISNVPWLSVGSVNSSRAVFSFFSPCFLLSTAVAPLELSFYSTLCSSFVSYVSTLFRDHAFSPSHAGQFLHGRPEVDGRIDLGLLVLIEIITWGSSKVHSRPFLSSPRNLLLFDSSATSATKAFWASHFFKAFYLADLACLLHGLLPGYSFHERDSSDISTFLDCIHVEGGNEEAVQYSPVHHCTVCSKRT